MAQTLPMMPSPIRPRGRGRLFAHISTVASCLVLLPLLVMPALAQDATPTADRFAFAEPRLIDPRECAVTPLPVEIVAPVLRLESDGVPQPIIPAVPSALGQVADKSVRTANEGAVRELIASFNAGDMPRATALMTARGLQCLYWG